MFLKKKNRGGGGGVSPKKREKKTDITNRTQKRKSSIHEKYRGTKKHRGSKRKGKAYTKNGKARSTPLHRGELSALQKKKQNMGEERLENTDRTKKSGGQEVL